MGFAIGGATVFTGLGCREVGASTNRLGTGVKDSLGGLSDGATGFPAIGGERRVVVFDRNQSGRDCSPCGVGCVPAIAFCDIPP